MTTELSPGTRPELQPGSTFGPYRIVRLLGRGGMGAVYEAEHVTDGRIVALKLLSVDLDKMDSRERFLREGQSAAAINHPNAVYIYGTEEIEGTPAISMELVPGGTLEDRIKEKGPLPWNEAIEFIIQIIDGLDAALAAGVLHRDVKPANCFIGSDGVVKIGDFGLSKPVGGEEAHKLTQTGLFLGTPVFSSPEQLLGENLDERSDIYAVGVTFYQLLTGKLPYAASGSMMQVVAAVLNGVPAPLAEVAPGVPQPVIDVVSKAMARKAADRYQSYAEFREAVASLRAAEVAPATLWDRFRASFVDWVVLGSLAWLASLLLFRNLAELVAMNSRSAMWRQTALSVAIQLLVVGIPEGLFGKSIGKWIVGIRVIGPDGRVPGLPRAAARVLLLALTDFFTVGMQMTVRKEYVAVVTLLAMGGSRALFLITARRSNGWRLLHDTLTGTRVVMSRASVSQRRGEAHRVSPPVITGNEARVGPYVVLGRLNSGSANASANTNASLEQGIVRGWDPAMRRAVWIVPRAIGTPETSPARRTLSRLTRLRWVGGRRTDGEAWDVFEAPVGESLRERLSRPVSWDTQREWLEDLSTELIAAEADGTVLPSMTADDLWVTPTDRLVFPERETNIVSTSTRASNGNPPSLALVPDLLDRVHRANASARSAEPLPGYTTRALADARAAQRPEDVLAAIRSTLGRPLGVSRLRRGSMMLATLAPIILMSFIGTFSARQGKNLDREGYLMTSLVSFVHDSASTNRDSVVRRAAAVEHGKWTTRTGAALERLGVLVASDPDTITPPDTLRRQRRLAEAYLSTVLRKRALDTNMTSMFGNTPKDIRRRTLIVVRNPTVDSATAREARVLVDNVWKGEVPGALSAEILRVIPLTIVASFVLIGALVSIIVGLLARRGLLLRGFQVDLVTRNGLRAGRLRVLLRNLAIWFVVPVAVLICILATSLSVRALATTMLVAAIVSALLLVLGIVSNLRSPSRGISERLTGTWLVPE